MRNNEGRFVSMVKCGRVNQLLPDAEAQLGRTECDLVLPALVEARNLPRGIETVRDARILRNDAATAVLDL